MIMLNPDDCPLAEVAGRIEPPGPAFGRPDDKLSEIRDCQQRHPRVSLALNPGYSFKGPPVQRWPQKTDLKRDEARPISVVEKRPGLLCRWRCGRGRCDASAPHLGPVRQLDVQELPAIGAVA